MAGDGHDNAGLISLPLVGLPTCRWRTGPSKTGLVKCKSPKLRSPAGGFPGRICLTCYCKDHEPVQPVRPQVNIVPRRTPRVPCFYRGEPTGRTEDCKTCGGSVKIKLLVCEKHGECTIAKMVPGVHCCETCDDHKPTDSHAIRPGSPD